MESSKHVLVVGDYIEDLYRMFNSTRLCPEAPVPVLVTPKPTEQQPWPDFKKEGGAALVTAQLRALIGWDNVTGVYGSRSKKERIFADGHLICRIDQDGYLIHPRPYVYETIHNAIQGSSLILVSDYGKGGMDEKAAKIVMDFSFEFKIPVLVDAKKNWEWYRGAFAFFPNRHESTNVSCLNLIQKLGAEGCSVNRQMVPPDKERGVRDVTGAGDIFLAAFASRLLSGHTLLECATFANHVAGLSVQYVGTHVVTKFELDKNPL